MGKTPLPFHQETGIAIYHGDSAEIIDDLHIKADLIVTSPPYDGLRDYGIPDFDFPAMAQACVNALKPGATLVWIVADGFINHTKSATSMKQALAFIDLGLNLHDVMVYHKQGLFNRTNVRYAQAWEYMFILTKGKPKTVNLLHDRPNATAGRKTLNYYNGFGRRPDGRIAAPAKNPPSGPTATPEQGIRTNIWSYPVGGNGNQTGNAHYKNEHPARFPLALARDHILSWSNPGDTVLDPMAGSGTTIRAAKDLGRLATGIDIKESYCRSITEWLAQEVFDLHQRP